jgi:hypothetical protein
VGRGYTYMWSKALEMREGCIANGVLPIYKNTKQDTGLKTGFRVS